jgi:hypothetical protein
MSTSKLRRLLGCLMSVALLGSCSNEPSAGILVNHSGTPAPVSIQATPGKCRSFNTTQSDGKLLSTAECGGPVGRITIAVRCPDLALPLALIVQDFPNGESHYVAFHDACSSTKEEIERGNSVRQIGQIWRPGK